MLLILLSFLGGAITIASPCILPIIPFVFARADRPFRSSGLPRLVGMALAFALVSTLASVGGSWVVQANQYGRYLALGLLAIFAATMISPMLSERLMRPLVRLGGRLSAGTSGKSGVRESFVLGIATGFLWAPCAGPILGLVLTGAALGGGSHLWTATLLFAYALGAASVLALILLGGQRVFDRMKRSLGIEEQIRRGLGVAILVGIAIIAFGLDRGILAKISEGSTAGYEQQLIAKFHLGAAASGSQMESASDGALVHDEGKLPALPQADAWINTKPLTATDLRGKVVLIDFWTYSCINCLRTLPAVKAWYETYKGDGFVVVGVHTPEFAFERERGNVEKAVHDLGITYPVGLDNDYGVWSAFHNEYWPAHYLVDAKGEIRYHHFGEGDEATTERAIRALLRERGVQLGDTATISGAQGVEAQDDSRDNLSPESYIGTDRGERFVGIHSLGQTAALESSLSLNHWGLSGAWRRSGERGALVAAPGSISFRFHARDVHLVLGTDTGVTAVPFRVFIDGKAVGDSHGSDVDAAGSGIVTTHRLYQLVRQQGVIVDHTVRIEFLKAGVSAYAFTFG